MTRYLSLLRKSYQRFEHELTTIADHGKESNEDSAVTITKGQEPASKTNHVDMIRPDEKLSEQSTTNFYKSMEANDGVTGKSYVHKSEDATGKEWAKDREHVFQKASDFFDYDPKEHELDDELGFEDPSNPPTSGCNLKYLRWKTRRFVEHFVIRILTALFIVVDMIILIVELANKIPDDPLEYWSLGFSIYFITEVFLRIFGIGLFYFAKWYNILDFILVIVTFALSILTILMVDMYSNAASIIVALRLIRLLRITRLLWQRRHLQTGARQFISQNKRRYQQDDFDLDLTYVASRIIAMSFPSSGSWSLYRNDIKEVARFLNKKHKDHYRVYNLCRERHYNIEFFYGNVERFKIDDHNVPSIEEMLQFSENVRQWMSQDESNVIAVHCKGGKGRTGTMICVVLIDTGLFDDATHCLGFFGERRTDKNVGEKFQGVETPSQSRYVQYYEHVVKSLNRQLPPDVPLTVKGFTIKGIGRIGAGDASEFTITIRSRDQVLPFLAAVGIQKNCKNFQRKDVDEVYIELVNGPKVEGDTKVMFHANSIKIPNGYDNCPFFFWFHTAFITDNKLELKRIELDNPHKSKTWKTFQENFKVVTHFISS